MNREILNLLILSVGFSEIDFLIDLPRLKYILKSKVEIYKILELFLNNDELRSQMDKITRMFKVHTDSFYIGLNQAVSFFTGKVVWSLDQHRKEFSFHFLSKNALLEKR